MTAGRIRSLLMLLIMGLGTYRCGVDNEKIEQQLVGDWILEQQDNNQCEDSEENGSQGFICSSLFCSRLIFSDSSSYTIEITTEGITTSDNGLFTIEGSALELCSDPDEDEAAICTELLMTLTGQTLIINGTVKVGGCYVRQRYVRN
ncbi:MAG: hypothetical protein AAGA85_17835 [Bacteroidota bacterium]